MPSLSGTHIDVKFSRVVDGDTIRVFLPNQEKDESLRILSLDAEESMTGGSKPVTPWGVKAKERAERFFAGADMVTIEFPGKEDLETSIKKYRGNYGRLLVYVYRDGVDFQETMIREGYSPYFVKYGNAEFSGHHQRYLKAERDAQIDHLGVWDQMTVNGSERRNYAALCTWWKLRAIIIDEYRKIKTKDPSVHDTRLDYSVLEAKAREKEKVTIFTELRTIQRIGSKSGLVSIGSNHQPFSLFIPDLDSDEGQDLAKFLMTRYISTDENHPRRSYAYVTGELSLFDGKPQMVVTSVDQVSDGVPKSREDTCPSSVLIVSLLPNPAGPDQGNERVTLRNTGATAVNLNGWSLQDLGNNRVSLTGILEAGRDMDLLPPPLNNSGDEVYLIDTDGKIRGKVSYSAQDVVVGQPIHFL